MTTVARLTLLRTLPASVLVDYQRLLCTLDLPEGAFGQPWIVVPALESRYPFPGANTPPWQLEGALQALQALGIARIRVHLAYNKEHHDHAYETICERYGVPFETDGDLPHSAALLLLPTLRRGPIQPLGGAGWLALRLRTARKAEHLSGATDIVEALEDLRGRSVVALMDATMVGNGASGQADHPEIGNLLIGSTDLVAIDSFAANLLGIAMSELPFLAEAQRRGLGIAELGDMELAGDADVQNLRWPAHQAARQWWPRRAGAFDNWPVQEREIYTRWLYDTAWGKLFAAYYNPRKSRRL